MHRRPFLQSARARHDSPGPPRSSSDCARDVPPAKSTRAAAREMTTTNRFTRRAYIDSCRIGHVRFRAGALLAIVACGGGLPALDGGVTPQDAAVDVKPKDVVVDVPVTGCNKTSPFGAPVLVSG